jgi:hypothetical protein
MNMQNIMLDHRAGISKMMEKDRARRVEHRMLDNQRFEERQRNLLRNYEEQKEARKLNLRQDAAD